MSGINKVILVGYINKDLQLRTLDGNVSVTSFVLSTSEVHFNKDGKKIEQTERHHVVMWRGLADVAVKCLSKGKLVYIEGKLRTRQFEDKEGNKKQITEIVAESFQLLGRRSDNIAQNTPVEMQNISEIQAEETVEMFKTEEQKLSFEFDDLTGDMN